MTAAHSPIPPSSSARRVQCPRSTTLEAQFPETEVSPEAAAGTASHWAAAEQLAGRLCDVGQIADNGIVLDDEMLKGADLFFDDVVKTLAPFGLRPEQGLIERRVEIPRVHPQSWGTPDYAILIDGHPRRLLLWDYKFGHRVVEAFENWQLAEYIAGITQGLDDLAAPVEITATIVQPRGYHRDGPVRRWHTSLLALRAQITIASNAAHAALGPDPAARVGPECRDCRGRHACEALQRAGFAAMDQATAITPAVLTPAAAGLELRLVRQALARLQARQSGLESQVNAQLRAGQAVPGWRIESSAGREKWTTPAAAVAALGEAFGVTVMKPAEPITPRQAREAGLPEALVAKMSERQGGASSLAEFDDADARRIFSR